MEAVRPSGEEKRGPQWMEETLKKISFPHFFSPQQHTHTHKLEAEEALLLQFFPPVSAELLSVCSVLSLNRH